jgi:3-mercaptopyruvate sulfurtransferase SseA
MPTHKTKPVKYDWEAEAKQLLKAELARAGVSHKVLVARLEAMGIEDNTAALASRITRGKFSFVFFLQCMRALGVDEVRVGERRSMG